MSEATSQTTWKPQRLPLTRQIIDLDAHPDGRLLRLCADLGKMRDAIADLETAIERTPARTIDGRRMKEMTL